MSKKNPTLKERLITLETIMDEIRYQFRNHLKHHLAINIVLLTALLGSIGTVLITLLRK